MINPNHVVLLDVEGTTSPINFVYETLFPYARKHVAHFLQEHQSDSEIVSLLSQLKDENKSDVAAGAPEMTGRALVQESTRYLLWVMDRNRKSTSLKTVQGLIWREGFARGEIQSEVFDDVPICFRRWQEKGLRIAIYSSGSILAQKLVFGHTKYGDLTSLIDAYFDTRVGSKKEAGSYKCIIEELKALPYDTVFVSDVTEELQAARATGLDTVLSVRPGNVVQGDAAEYRRIHSLCELEL